MVTISQRDNTIQAHVSALTKLGLTYQKEAGLFLQRAKQEKPSGLPSFLGTYLPQMNQPFQQASTLIGQRFMSIRSEQSGFGSSLPQLNREIQQAKIGEANVRLAALMETLIEKQRDGMRTPDQAIVKAMERPIVEADRAVILDLSAEINEIREVVVGVRSDGCDFCKSLSVNKVSASSGNANFHNACRCVFDATFTNDPRFSQSFHAEFKEQYASARAKIESGDLPPRIIQVRSKEWEKQMRRSLAAKISSERKVWEENSSPSQAEKTARRKQDADFVDRILGKAMEAKPLDDFEKKILEDDSLGVPFDTARLFQPIHRPWKNTERDVILLLQSEKASRLYSLEKDKLKAS